MKKILRTLVILPFLFCFTIGTAMADKYVTQEKSSLRGQTDPKKALVYIIRPSKVGSSVKSWAFLDDTFLGINKGKSYFFTHVKPGQHIIWSKMENISAIYYDFKPGQVYYFKQKVAPGFLKASTQILEVDATKGEKWLKKAKLSVPTDKGKIKGLQLAEKHFARAQERAKAKAAKLSRKKNTRRR